MSKKVSEIVKVDPDTLANFQNSILEWLGVDPIGEEKGKEPNDLVPARSLSRSSGRHGTRLSTSKTLSSKKSGFGGDK